MADICLKMKNIRKSFPGVLALNKVSFDLIPGEVHSLVGENGAGKSTLMKVLGGAYIPDSGEMEIFGQTADIRFPADSMNLGISIIYQEFNLVPTLSIAENMFLGKERVKNKLGALNRREMEEEAAKVLSRLGMDHLDCSTRVSSLSVAQQQLVEIGKAIFNNARILVMDEPTAVLSINETESLFSLMRELKAEGIAIIYISHRLEEVLDLSDRITVLRDGEVICTMDNHDHQILEDDLVTNMVGRQLSDIFPLRPENASDKTVLEVEQLSKEDHFEDISFYVKEGEIVGFSGLVGAGRSEIMRALSGFYGYDKGCIYLNGDQISIRDTEHAISQGIVLVPEDRKREGLVLKMSLGENITLPNMKKISSWGHIKKSSKNKMINHYLEKLQVRPLLPDRAVKNFSGGNQQKAVIAKWLATNPKVIIFDEPTRGVDIGAKVEIYKLIDELARNGAAIVFISSEQMEVLGMCDRIYTVFDGKISSEFSRAEATQENLMRASAGIN
jgi:ribose transport system ATP-binding protein